MFRNLFKSNIRDNTPNVLAMGSKAFTYDIPIIAAGATSWFDVRNLFPESVTFEPLDSIIVQSNYGSSINFYLNTTGDDYPIPAYMIQPIARRACWRFAIRNNGLVDTVAGDIKITLRRLPPDIQPTVNVS